MGLSIKGYVLEPPRVGQSNSPFTFTPNDEVANSGTFNAYYTPGSETVSRSDYCTVVQTEGLLVNAAFGWTKNEGGTFTTSTVRRFDYDSLAGHFKPLPGAPPDAVGVLDTTANTTRLKVVPPIGVLVAAPFRLSVGTGSGTTLLTSLVLTFGAPVVGTVEILSTTGELNWNPADITTYLGQTVHFQRQSYFAFSDSTGLLGLAQAPFLLLNPIPGTGQYPRVRFGFGFYLTPIQVATEGGFSPNPVAGTVEWALSTGRLKFNSGDVIANTGKPVYYDGVLFSWKQILPTQFGGLVTAPLPLVPIPPPGGDIIFRLVSGYQFPAVRRVTVFDAGTAGEVQVRTDGAVGFSTTDQATYGAASVSVYIGDLPIERGVSMRFFRSPVNLNGLDPTVKDVSAIYSTTGAIWANPIIEVPYVLLPTTPLQDPGYPLVVKVEQGTGSFTGTLPDLGGVAPPVGLGYILDYEARQLYYARRQVNQIQTFGQPGGTLQLQNIPVRPENLLLEVESSPGTGIFTPLVQGQSMLFDKNPGIITLTSQTGTLVIQSTAASFVGTLLTDPSVDFLVAGVQPGHQLVVPAGPAAGVFTIVARTATTLTTDLPAPGVGSDFAYEVRTAPEVIADRYFQEIVPVDPNTKVERIRALGASQNSTTVYVGGAPGQFLSATTLVDTLADFVTAGVQAGDTVLLTSGPDTGSYRTVTIVDTTTLTVDRDFTSFPSANYQIERRRRIPKVMIPRSRVRLGLTTFAILVQKPDNPSFTAPALLPAGTVEVSLQTGDLNFSQADVLLGVPAFWGLTLRLQLDYRISKDLGFIELIERLLTNDEMYVTYKPVTSDGVLPPVTEHIGFLIRKELTQPWPRPTQTNQVPFNPAGRTVAANPAPAVFRGGRPQDDTQIGINLATSTVTFLPNVGFMTDALPSGSAVEVDERILVDYYVFEAVGGEKSFTVLQPPIFAAQVILHLASPAFILLGDQTAVFPANYLLRVEQQQVYLIGSSVYDPLADTTLITLAYGATFQDDFTNPKLYLSSGPIPLNPVFPTPSYFSTEIASFGAVPRGMNVFTLPGDATLQYPKGTVVLFTNSATYYDLYVVSGATFKDGVTSIILQQNVRQQYMTGTTVLKRSIRPILEDGVTQAQLRSIPILEQGVILFRRVTGQPGVIMVTPDEYTLDGGGALTYTPPLQPNESIDIFYTSYRIAQAGTRIRASYTSLTVPSDSNGLLGQILKADYSIFAGDSFYYRVETLTNFSAEVLETLQASAQSSSPSSGPTTSNASTPTLFQQGRESLFFTEGHTANVDYVSRQYLKFFNDNTHRLEDVLQDEDGRYIGDTNGRFRFDGKIGNPVRTVYSAVTNEIDDTFKISDFPVVITSIFPLVFTYVGTYVQLYQPSNYGRLFPTAKEHLSLVTTAGTPLANTGDVIGDFGAKPMTSLPGTIYRRLPRALVQQPAAAGSTTLFVDNASGSPTFLRPPFAVGMKVAISNRDGTVIVPDAVPLTVTAVLTAPERIQMAGLPFVPAGATVFLSTKDTVYQKLYRQGFDMAVNTDAGQLVFIKPYPPLDGSVPIIPAELRINPPGPGEVLQMDYVGVSNLATAAFKFPALVGEIGSDCNDQGIPILSPIQAQEILANQAETAVDAAVNGSTTSPTTLSGMTLDGTGTVLTYTGPFPIPLPQVYDLVQFTTGPNAGTGYRRISVVGPTSVTVDSAFPSPGVGGDAVITATNNVGPVSAATFPLANVLDDPALSPLIKVGFTVILTTGANAGVRRQVTAILSPTQLQLNSGVPFLVPTSYRVSDHLNTFSNTLPIYPSVFTQQSVLLTNDHDVMPAVADSVVLAITRFFEGDAFPPGTDGVLSDLLTPASNPGTVAAAILTDAGQDFVTAGVNATHFVYIEVGGNAQFYAIQSVDSPTQITVTTPFPVAGIVSYRVVKAFGVGAQAIQDLFTIRADAQAWVQGCNAWTALLATSTSVYVPPGIVDPLIYANPWTALTFFQRLAALAVRLAAITGPTGPIPLVTAIVKTRDKLYDKRYAWIDARTNVQTGSLYVIQRAVADRATATAKLYNDLLKILSVQTV